MLTSIETTATMGAGRQLTLDDDIPVEVSGRVRVIVLFDDDVADADWMKSAASNSVFDFLADEEEIYSLEDGTPLSDEA